jgi:hypothetical protein
MTGFTCATCGKFHEELPLSFGPSAPLAWFGVPERERSKRTELSSDQCIVDGQHFFVLGRILLSIKDYANPFVWLAWVSLSENNFRRTQELWDRKGREEEPPYFGWLSSSLPYEPSTVSLKTMVHTQPVGERPVIELEPTDHPLSIEQRHGITLHRAQEIAERLLHENAP